MADDFAKEVRELLTWADDADKDNREQAFIDLDFEGFKQWDPRVRQYRESYVDPNGNPQPLPCFTINTAQQYTALVVGDWLTNETSITVLPREDGDVKVAEVRSELIRSIELQSKADRIYSSSLGQMVACGISNFRVDVERAYEDAFEQDIFINDIPDPLAVRWDPLANDPTAHDATFCFVGESVTTKEYERRFPKAAKPSLIDKEAGQPWSDGNIVLLPEYWKLIERDRTFGMTADGKTVDLTDIPQNQWPPLSINQATGQPIVREKAKCKYAVMVPTNGMEPLADPFELKLPRLPIIRVMGRETRTRDGRVRFGIIRGLRDSQRYKNYIRSVRAELLMRAPRVNFIAPKSAVEGNGDWENTLTFEGTVAPTEVTARNLAALLNEEEMFARDMMETTGLHEASRGMPSNEKSGVAIRERQEEGDVATVVYHKNMGAAQQEAGEVINALIPVIYDTARTIRTVGADMAIKMVRVNDQSHPENVDIGLGKYDVVASSGPRHQTMRQQAQELSMSLIQAYPPLAQVIGDLVIKETDGPGAEKMAERVKRSIDPKFLGDDADDGKDPQEVEAQKQKAQQAEQLQQMGMQLEMADKQAETRLKTAQADKAEAEAMKAKAEAMQSMQGGEAGPDPNIAMQDIRLKSALADKAESEAVKASIEAYVALQNAGGDTEAAERLKIEAFNAFTKRIQAINPHILQANEPEPPAKDIAA